MLKKCICCGASEKEYPYLFDEEECPKCGASSDFIVEDEND